MELFLFPLMDFPFRVIVTAVAADTPETAVLCDFKNAGGPVRPNSCTLPHFEGESQPNKFAAALKPLYTTSFRGGITASCA